MTDDSRQKLKLIRAERYAMQSVAKKALPKERVSKCLRWLNHSSGQVNVWKHLKTERAFYTGLMVCGSIWNCPVCASKISEKRKIELKKAFDMWLADGGKIAFLTLTFSHKKYDSLKDILDRFSEASRTFKSGRYYQDLKDVMGIEGTIKGLEVTYSDFNGFHPHSHEVIFYKNEVDLEKIKTSMWKMWVRALTIHGLKATRQRGLTLQSGKDANDYLSKFGQGHWTLEQELTKAHIKKGKGKQSLTPFDFLKFYLETENRKYILLFQEYAKVFKGKNQLVWSRGLKKKFIIEEKSDSELAQERTEQADLLGDISFDTWRYIIKYDYRSLLLDCIEKYGFEEGYNMILDKIKDDITQDDTAKK